MCYWRKTISQVLYSLHFTIYRCTWIYSEFITVGKLENWHLSILCWTCCIKLHVISSLPSTEDSSIVLNVSQCFCFCDSLPLHNNQSFPVLFLCFCSSPASGAIRGSALHSEPGLRVWTEAGGPGPCGGSAAGPVGAVYPPPWGTVTAQRK